MNKNETNNQKQRCMCEKYEITEIKINGNFNGTFDKATNDVHSICMKQCVAIYFETDSYD